MRMLSPSALRTLSALVLLSARGTPAGADCPGPAGVVLNEVRYVEGESPMGGGLLPLVELVNTAAGAADLTGWEVRSLDGSYVAAPGPVLLPAGGFLVVVLGTGAGDLDFSDGVGVVYTGGDSTGVFDPDEDAAALYDGLAAVVDFVQWSVSGAPPGGPAASDAVAAGIWTAGDHVRTDPAQTLFSLARTPDGYDSDAAADWVSRGWGASRYGTAVPGPNPVQLTPADGAALVPGPVTLTWTALDSAQAYRLEVATDSTFAGGAVVDATTAAVDTTVVLGTDTYYWRVRMIDACGEVDASVGWEFSVFAPGVPSAPNSGLLGVVRETQRKDSGMLCVWDDRKLARPGCDETATDQGPWDGAHAVGHAAQAAVVGGRPAETHCRHCAYYCARACVAMINRHYGGDLLQDRIAYRYMLLERGLGKVVASPEGDLGHHLPVSVSSVAPVLSWAVTGSGVTGPVPFTFGDLAAEIDAGRPMIGLIAGAVVSHVVVVDGYAEPGAWGAGSPGKRMVHILDPWPGAGNSNGWVAFTRSPVSRIWRLTGAGLAGRLQEATVTADGDGDGVVDFDEGAPDHPASRPRLFACRADDPDTENDDLRDKQEIRGYVFHACGDNDPLAFPDVDGDGIRAEADCDSDDGGLFDGGEDVGGLGVCNGATDPFDDADDGIGVATDKPVYFPPEVVLLTGAPFHADTTYPFANIPTCPDLVDQAGIGGGGALGTGPAGVMPYQPVATCTTPGLVLTVVDLRREGVYEEPDCLHPSTCWVCLGDFWHDDLDDEGTHDDLDLVVHDPQSVAWAVTPDFMHTGSGFHAELNGPGEPQKPINAGLRIPPFHPDPGEQVLLTYWTAFFSQGMQGAVRISPNGGLNWQLVAHYDQAFNGFQGIEVLDLTPYLAGFPSKAAGAAVPILVEFLALGPPGSGGWFLDDPGVGYLPPSTTGTPGDGTVPAEFLLAQNRPNPFGVSTSIAFEVPGHGGTVSLRVFDVAGRLVRTLVDAALPAGRHLEFWNGRDASGRETPPGVYFYRLEGEGFAQVKKMIRVRP